MPEEIFETPQTVEPKSTNWPKIILAAVLGFGLLAGACYAGYWYGTQQTQQLGESPTVSQSIPTPTPTSKPTPQAGNETANWKTFTSAKAKISFKYPELWYVQDVSSFGGADEGSTYGFFLSGTDADPSYGDHRGNEVFVFNSSESDYSIEDLEGRYKDSQQFTVDGRPAVRSGSIILIPIKDRLIHLGIAQNQAEMYVDQILSTFKLLD